MSYTTTATVESRIYDGIRLLNLSWPAVSCNKIYNIINDIR